MTRGRESNRAYVALDQPDDAHGNPLNDEDLSARTVLFGVLQHSGAELSAHQTITVEQETWSSIAQLAAEYDTIAAAAQRDRWADLVRSSGLTATQADAVIKSDAFGPLTAALRRAEACGRDVQRLVPRLVAQRDMSDADDVGAVLRHRLRLAMSGKRFTRVSQRPGQYFIAGLIPEARCPMGQEMCAALDERKNLIEKRASALAEAAIAARPAWIRRLGSPLADAAAYEDWQASIATVAAYRDRYQITSDLPLGPGARAEAERADRGLALAALHHAAATASSPAGHRWPMADRVLR